jgi:hypothetical protein
MRNNTDLPEFGPCDVSSLVMFPTYDVKQSRFGFNPYARGYKSAVAMRLAVLIVVCSMVAIISGSLWACDRLAAWQAVLGIMVPMLPVIAMEWSWRRSSFCGSCGARIKSPRKAWTLIWCPACHSLGDPARITVEAVGKFNVTGIYYLAHVDPVMRFLDSVALWGIKDHAQEIRFKPEEYAYKIRFAIQDKIQELESFPNWLAAPVAQAVKAIAGLDVGTCDRRQEGHIHITCGGHDLPTEVVVEPAEFGPKITLHFVFEYWINPCRCSSCLAAQHSVGN